MARLMTFKTIFSEAYKKTVSNSSSEEFSRVEFNLHTPWRSSGLWNDNTRVKE